MEVFLITLAVLLLVAVALSVGAIFGRKCIGGSCGGLANFRDERGRSICEACTAPKDECRDRLLNEGEGDDEDEPVAVAARRDSPP